MGAANASPVSVAAGTRRIPSGDFTAPKTSITAMNTVHAVTTRTAIQVRCPRATSATRSGVASMASYVRNHLMAAITGQLASSTAVCIAVAAISAGARNTR